jgi:hypothetical protein
VILLVPIGSTCYAFISKKTKFSINRSKISFPTVRIEENQLVPGSVPVSDFHIRGKVRFLVDYTKGSTFFYYSFTL